MARLVVAIFFDKGTGGIGKKSTGGDYSKYNIIKISQNTEKGSGDLRFAFTQSTMDDLQLTLMQKILKGEKIMIITKRSTFNRNLEDSTNVQSIEYTIKPFICNEYSQ